MRGDRPADLKYLVQLAQAAEINGFEAVLTPTGQWCEDAWLTTAMLIGSTESLKYLVALRPGLVSPTLAAQMAATFQWQSQGRLLLNVVTGGESIEQRAFGDFLPKQARYARCGEFLDIVRRLWTSEGPVTVAGEGFAAGREFDLVWGTVTGSWKVSNAEYFGREYTPAAYRIATVKSDAAPKIRDEILEDAAERDFPRILGGTTVAGFPSTGSAGDFLPVGWDFQGFQTQMRRWRLIVRVPKSTTSARDHDVSEMAPPSRMMRAHRSRIAANMSNMAAPICKKICRPWRTILPAV